MSSSNFLDLDVDGGVPGGVKEELGLGGGQLTGLGEIAKSDCIQVGFYLWSFGFYSSWSGMHVCSGY